MAAVLALLWRCIGHITSRLTKSVVMFEINMNAPGHRCWMSSRVSVHLTLDFGAAEWVVRQAVVAKAPSSIGTGPGTGLRWCGRPVVRPHGSPAVLVQRCTGFSAQTRLHKPPLEPQPSPAAAHPSWLHVTILYG